MLFGFIFVILIPVMDSAISKLSEDNSIRKWWGRHICEYDDSPMLGRKEIISSNKDYRYWLKIRKTKKK
jgi:hypothetical protein